jgi:hypothetical protein
MSNNKVIKVVVRNGVVTIADTIPKGVIVIIVDYDTEGRNETDTIQKDDEGKEYIVSIYDNNHKYKQL